MRRNGSRREQTANEQTDPSGGRYLLLVLVAFLLQVRRVAVQDVHVVRKDVNVTEEIVEHVRMVALRMVARNTFKQRGSTQPPFQSIQLPTDILVHIEC